MQLDYIDPSVVFILTPILWAMFLAAVFRHKIKDAVGNYFANRRHIRREKCRQERDYAAMVAYAQTDLEKVTQMFDPQRPRKVSAN